MYDRIRTYIENAGDVFVFTGAGVAVASGLGTYRDEDGQLEQEFEGHKPTELSHIKTLKANPRLFWAFKRKTLIQGLYVKPNPAHIALVLLEKYCEREKKGFTLVTQNVERLHQRAGSKNVVEVHGQVTELHCTNQLSCRKIVNTVDHLAANPEPVAPRCPYCSSVLRPPVVLFGEQYPNKMIDLLKMKIKNYADLFISAGTSYQLFSPITAFPRIFKAYRENGVLLDFNLNQTHVSRQFAELFVEGPCDETLWRSTEFLHKDFPAVPYIYELRNSAFDGHPVRAKLREIQRKTGAGEEALLDLARDAFQLDDRHTARLKSCVEDLDDPGKELEVPIQDLIASNRENWSLLI